MSAPIEVSVIEPYIIISGQIAGPRALNGARFTYAEASALRDRLLDGLTEYKRRFPTPGSFGIVCACQCEDRKR